MILRLEHPKEIREGRRFNSCYPVKRKVAQQIKHCSFIAHSFYIAAFQWLDTPPGTERVQVRVLPAIQTGVVEKRYFGIILSPVQIRPC